MRTLLQASDINLTAREFAAGVIAIVSLCSSLAFGYGVKAQQVAELQTIVMRHDLTITSLSSELTQLRVAVAELNGTLKRGK